MKESRKAILQVGMLCSGLAGEKITLLLDRGVGVLRFAGDDDRAN